MSKLPAIALFTYKRPEHLRRTVQALTQNRGAEEFDLIIFSDAPKQASDQVQVEAVRSEIGGIGGFKKVAVIERSTNLGLAGSIISGVSETLKKYPAIIVLEDDMLTSPGFLDFMRQGLEQYADEPMVSSICAYSPYPQSQQAQLPESYFLPGADCWGWATWPRAWRHFREDAKGLAQEIESRGLIEEFDLQGSQKNFKMLRDYLAGTNDSWAIRWHASCFLRGMLYLCPRLPLIENIGVDGSGTHCIQNPAWNPGPLAKRVEVHKQAIELNPAALENARLFFAKVNKAGSAKGMLSSLIGKAFGY